MTAEEEILAAISVGHVSLAFIIAELRERELDQRQKGRVIRAFYEARLDERAVTLQHRWRMTAYMLSRARIGRFPRLDAFRPPLKTKSPATVE